MRISPALPQAGVYVAGIVGWGVSALAAMPLAVATGIWLTGWERPPNTMSDPLAGDAGPEILLVYGGLFLVVTVFWIWLARRVSAGSAPVSPESPTDRRRNCPD